MSPEPVGSSNWESTFRFNEGSGRQRRACARIRTNSTVKLSQFTWSLAESRSGEISGWPSINLNLMTPSTVLIFPNIVSNHVRLRVPLSPPDSCRALSLRGRIVAIVSLNSPYLILSFETSMKALSINKFITLLNKKYTKAMFFVYFSTYNIKLPLILEIFLRYKSHYERRSYKMSIAWLTFH